MSEMYKIDLRKLANKHVYPIFQLSYRNLFKENNQFQLVSNNSDLLLQMYQSYKKTPFVLHSAHLNKDEELELVAEKNSLSGDELLLLTCHQCPGPIAEILVKLNCLEDGQNLWVALFMNKMAPEKITKQLIKRGYSISQTISHKAHTLIMCVNK